MPQNLANVTENSTGIVNILNFLSGECLSFYSHETFYDLDNNPKWAGCGTVVVVVIVSPIISILMLGT